MEALDGNAIGGQLLEVFGREMTVERGTCAHCDAPSQIAELAVYVRSPGTVVRCRTCGSIVMVMVTVDRTTCIDLAGFRLDAIS